MVNTLYPPLIIGGAEKSVSLLAEALVRSGDEVSVVTLSPKRHIRIEELNGVLIYRLPLRNIYWPFHSEGRPNFALRATWQLLDIWNSRMARDLGNILDIERPEVVHTNNISGFSVSIFEEVTRRNIRLVHTLRDYYLLCSRYALFRHGKVCEQRCIDCALMTANRKGESRRPNAVISNSRFLLDTHVRYGCLHRVPASVIYNIAAPANPLDDKSVREKDAPSLHGLTFGFIGKICSEKGIEVVLAATKLLSRAEWRLRIAGSGESKYVALLKQQFDNPRIEWLGFAEPGAFYASIDVSMVASVWAEPLPRTLIETFTAGKSAICARSGGIPEIMMLGRVVETYEATDSSALAAAMDRALADPDRWRTGGWRDPQAMEAFSEATVTGRYHEVYSGSSFEALTNDHVRSSVADGAIEEMV